jgi:3'-phosphoadenosine 5'-phosphosulfate sulfotransferase (PAPS reductase)/FAD synthetase
LTQDYTKTIDNFRIQRLMGILPLTGKATMENIPSKGDRSAFSCARYQFFLDAPFEIGNQCCNVMKKSPGKAYQKRTGRVPMTAQMASESRLRTQIWLKQGCNAFDAKKPMSNPMAFWTEQDVLLYIYQTHRPICSVYGEVVKEQGQDGQMDLADYFGTELFVLERPTLKTTGYNRTGCMFCGFGCHLEKPGEGRFERMKHTHPKQYDYIMRPWEEGGLNYKEVIDWINEHGDLHIRY